MKKIIFILLVISLFYLNIHAQVLKVENGQRDYWGNSHEWIVDQANQFLLHKLGHSYFEIVNYLLEIKIGDTDEDEFDPVYGYGGLFNWNVTNTHFWDADISDDQTNYWPFHNYPNAYTKVQKYIHGNYDLHMSDDHNPPISHKFQYPDRNGDFGLIDFYKTGYVNCAYHGWETHNVHTRTVIALKLLGHMCHLLQDMSVPIHSHVFMHPDECYEEYVGFNGLPGYQTAGEFVSPFSPSYGPDPIRGLFYTANQIADLFPSNNQGPGGGCINPNIPGDNSFSPGSISILNNYYASIFPSGYYQNFNLSQQGYHLGNYSINATASLLYWFATLANLTYSYPAPYIVSATQNPIPICKGYTGTITCNMVAGQNPNNYSWTWVEKNPDSRPAGVIVDPASTHTNILTIANPLSDIDKVKEGNKPPWHFYATASNENGSHTFQVYPYVVTASCYYGCPWVIVTDQDTNFHFDNNLLNKSQLPENQGNFITDKYILKTKPGIFDNKIKLSIVETSIDSTLINSIKLYTINHPIGTKLGILSDNTIVMYDSASVIDNKSASLYDPNNNYTDITKNIIFNTSNKDNSNTTGDSLYHIYADYYTNTITNPGIITYMDRGIGYPSPIIKSDYSGNLFVNTPSGSSQFPFMRRENLDDVIIPVDQGSEESSVDNIHIAWDKSFKIRYAAVASLLYSGFNITEWYLTSAFHTSDGNVLQSLLYTDETYSYVSPNAYLNLEFSPSPAQGSSTSIKEYVLEINGQVIFLGSNKMKSMKVANPEQHTVPNKYSLSQNYPNPFNPVTKIHFSIAKQGFVTLKVYDMLGREIRSLVNETKQPGNYSVDFNGSNLSSGAYFYRLESNGFTSIKRMVLIK